MVIQRSNVRNIIFCKLILTIFIEKWDLSETPPLNEKRTFSLEFESIHVHESTKKKGGNQIILSFLFGAGK